MTCRLSGDAEESYASSVLDLEGSTVSPDPKASTNNSPPATTRSGPGSDDDDIGVVRHCVFRTATRVPHVLAAWKRGNGSRTGSYGQRRLPKWGAVGTGLTRYCEGREMLGDRGRRLARGVGTGAPASRLVSGRSGLWRGFTGRVCARHLWSPTPSWAGSTRSPLTFRGDSLRHMWPSFLQHFVTARNLLRPSECVSVPGVARSEPWPHATPRIH